MTNKPHIQIYTDGGADPNPGPGGWGAVLIHPQKTRELSGGEPDTTNNRMELTAAIEALRALKQPCVIDLYTDSLYLRRGITEWIHKWVNNNWRGGTIANVDLWQQLHHLTAQHDITWHWVKGHAGDDYNERAHQLASAAIPRQAQVIDSDVAQVYLRIAGPAKGGQGACGWAAGIVRGEELDHLQGGHPDISVNHFVLYAALDLLALLPPEEPIQFFTNNSYLFDGITKWVDGWRRVDWAKPDKYRDEWQALDRENFAREIKWFRQKDLPEDLKPLEKRAKEARDELN